MPPTEAPPGVPPPLPPRATFKSTDKIGGIPTGPIAAFLADLENLSDLIKLDNLLERYRTPASYHRLDSRIVNSSTLPPGSPLLEEHDELRRIWAHERGDPIIINDEDEDRDGEGEGEEEEGDAELGLLDERTEPIEEMTGEGVRREGGPAGEEGATLATAGDAYAGYANVLPQASAGIDTSPCEHRMDGSSQRPGKSSFATNGAAPSLAEASSTMPLISPPPSSRSTPPLITNNDIVARALANIMVAPAMPHESEDATDYRLLNLDAPLLGVDEDSNQWREQRLPGKYTPAYPPPPGGTARVLREMRVDINRLDIAAIFELEIWRRDMLGLEPLGMLVPASKWYQAPPDPPKRKRGRPPKQKAAVVEDPDRLVNGEAVTAADGASDANSAMAGPPPEDETSSRSLSPDVLLPDGFDGDASADPDFEPPPSSARHGHGRGRGRPRGRGRGGRALSGTRASIVRGSASSSPMPKFMGPEAHLSSPPPPPARKRGTGRPRGRSCGRGRRALALPSRPSPGPSLAAGDAERDQALGSTTALVNDIDPQQVVLTSAIVGSASDTSSVHPDVTQFEAMDVDRHEPIMSLALMDVDSHPVGPTQVAKTIDNTPVGTPMTSTRRKPQSDTNEAMEAFGGGASSGALPPLGSRIESPIRISSLSSSPERQRPNSRKRRRFEVESSPSHRIFVTSYLSPLSPELDFNIVPEFTPAPDYLTYFPAKTLKFKPCDPRQFIDCVEIDTMRGDDTTCVSDTLPKAVPARKRRNRVPQGTESLKQSLALSSIPTRSSSVAEVVRLGSSIASSPRPYFSVPSPPIPPPPPSPPQQRSTPSALPTWVTSAIASNASTRAPDVEEEWGDFKGM